MIDNIDFYTRFHAGFTDILFSPPLERQAPSVDLETVHDNKQTNTHTFRSLVHRTVSFLSTIQSNTQLLKMFAEIFIAVTVALGVKLSLFFIQRKRLYRSFSRRGIPGPSPDLLSGNFYQQQQNKSMQPHQVIDKWLKEYGDVFGYFIGSEKYLLVRDLDLLKKVFIEKASLFRNRPKPAIDVQPISTSIVFLRDDDWKRVRKTISPVFGQHKVQSEAITATIDQCTQRLMTSIKEKAVSRDETSFVTEVFPLIQATSLDVIARTSLNMTSVDVHNDKDVLTNAVREYFSEAVNIGVVAALYLPFLRPLMTFVNDYLTAGAMTDLVIGHIKQQIMSAEKDHLKGEVTTSFLNSLLKNLHTGKLTEREVIANAHIVLLAGYETTATAVTFLLILLAQHQDIQDRLRDYFKREDSGDKLDKDYFEMVWLEGLRLYPPVTLFVSREASEDFDLEDGRGTVVEKGTVVQAPVWQIHRDPHLYPNPTKYDPERFDPEVRKNMHPMSFLTFGAGPRICLGFSLSTHEAKIIVKNILSQYQISTTSNQKKGEIETEAHNIFICPTGKVPLTFSPL